MVKKSNYLFFLISLFRFVFYFFPSIFFISVYFVLVSLISFCFRWFRFILFSFRWFRFVSLRFCWFRFVSFRFVSFSLISFRFVSFLFRFALYRCPLSEAIISNDKQYNGQMKQGKKINNDLQNITQKTKDWATRTPPNKTGVHSCNMYILSLFIIMISLMQPFSEKSKNP